MVNPALTEKSPAKLIIGAKLQAIAAAITEVYHLKELSKGYEREDRSKAGATASLHRPEEIWGLDVI